MCVLPYEWFPLPYPCGGRLLSAATVIARWGFLKLSLSLDGYFSPVEWIVTSEPLQTECLVIIYCHNNQRWFKKLHSQVSIVNLRLAFRKLSHISNYIKDHWKDPLELLLAVYWQHLHVGSCQSIVFWLLLLQPQFCDTWEKKQKQWFVVPGQERVQK